MPASTAPIPFPEVLQCWRRQIGRVAHATDRRGVRPFLIVSYRLRGPLAQSASVDLRQSTLVALFDERLASGRLATRLVGVSGNLAADRLRFGGAELIRFDKDLRLYPAPGGPGPRLDPQQGQLLAWALQLDRYLERCARYPYYPRRRVPHLPQLASERASDGATLVDFCGVHKRQVITYSSVDDLRGRAGSTDFDFYSTRYSRAH